jgi:hypothetical protein
VLFQYSIPEALITIAMMCVFLYAGNLPPQLATQSLFDYYVSLALNPVMWLGMTILLGGLKLRNNAKLLELQKELKKARAQERVISESFEKLKTTNRALELRLSEELGSAIKIYRAAVTLEDMDVENQMDGINKIVASILNPDKFSIFVNDEEGMALSSSYAWGKDDKYARRFGRTPTSTRRWLPKSAPGGLQRQRRAHPGRRRPDSRSARRQRQRSRLRHAQDRGP